MLVESPKPTHICSWCLCIIRTSIKARSESASMSGNFASSLMKIFGQYGKSANVEPLMHRTIRPHMHVESKWRYV